MFAFTEKTKLNIYQNEEAEDPILYNNSYIA